MNALNMLNGINEKYIAEAGKIKNGKRKRIISVCAAAAVCAVMAVGISGALFPPQSYLLPLSEYSKNVKISLYEADDMRYTQSLSDTEYLSQKQIFSKAESAFMAEILEIQNVMMDFDGVILLRAIATVRVEKSYLGSCSEGDTVTILLPCPITEGYWVEDTDVIAQMREGYRGIFLLKDHGEDDYYITNNAALLLSDAADYGFYDGFRFAFVETESGLVFDEVHEKLQGATSLSEAEEYVLKMLR